MELRNVTVPELAAAIAQLPPAVRAELAKGPAPDWRCRFCRSFRAAGMLNEEDLDEPSRIVWQWHEDHEVLAARAFTDTFVEGNPTDEEVDLVTRGLNERGREPVAYAFAGTLSYYRLCIAYLLAGWKPEPPVNGLEVDEVAFDEAGENRRMWQRAAESGLGVPPVI